MINPELQKYVETSLGDNFDAAAVRHALVAAGWSPTDVDAALAAAQGPQIPHAAKLPGTPMPPARNLQ
jgi:hypothetical protein